MKLRIRESDMKYNTYGNWNRAYDILVGEKGYTPDEAQEIISNIQRDYKYNPNSNDSIMRRIKLVLPKDEYEKEYRIKDTFGESGPADKLFKKFGFTVENVIKTVETL